MAKLTKEQKRKRKIAIRNAKYSALLMLAASVAFYAVMVYTGIIPSKYLRLLRIILLVVNLPLLFFGLVRKVKTSIKRRHTVTCVVLSILLIAMCFLIPHYEGKIFKLLTNIPKEGKLNINIYVLKSSGIDEIGQIADKKLAIQKKVDTEYQEYALKVINHEMGGAQPNKVEYDDIYKAVDALLANEVDAVMLNETYFDIIAENADYQQAAESIKSIFTCPVEVTLQYDTSAVTNIDKEPFVIAIAGTDSWDLGGLNRNGRTDVNMVVAVNPVTHRVMIVSIPRDGYVAMGGDSSKMDKLTHASIGGVDAWRKTLEKVLDVDINYFVKINFSSLVNIVDAIGGIDVDNPYEFSTKYVFYGEGKNPSDGTYTTFEKGMIHLDGQQALGYCRERYSLSNGDLGRNQHQVIMIKALINKVCSAAVITKVDKLLNAVEGSFISDLKENEYKALAQMQLRDWPIWKIESVNITGSNGSAESYYVGLSLSMVFLSDNSVADAKAKLQEVLRGE
ncbi:MAG: LCP family protein [Erysipelotrichaceae bacterium]|nr:LCP family protein [Erysipelotrichaceae bacterium]